MTTIYPKDSDQEAIVDFVKDHKELYDKTYEHIKDKVRKKCLTPIVASFLSKCARPGLIHKIHIIAGSSNPNLVSHQTKRQKDGTEFRINLTS